MSRFGSFGLALVRDEIKSFGYLRYDIYYHIFDQIQFLFYFYFVFFCRLVFLQNISGLGYHAKDEIFKLSTPRGIKLDTFFVSNQIQHSIHSPFQKKAY